MQLYELPDELLCEVFSQVDNLRARLSISLTCRKFERINEEYLYRHLYDREIRGHDERLLRPVMKRPYVARHVRELVIDLLPYQSNPSPIEESDDSITKNIVDEVESRIPARKPAGPSDYANKRAAVLLALLPNLETLSVPIAGEAHHWLFGFTMVAAGKPWPNAFSNLKTINLALQFWNRWSLHEAMMLVLGLPSLRTLRGKFEHERYQVSGNTRPPPLPSTYGGSPADSKVEVLEFYNVNTESLLLGHFLLRTQKTLKSLRLGLVESFSPFMENLCSNLAAVAQTLESLEIYCSFYDNTNFEFPSAYYVGGLEKLKSLAWQTTFLVDQLSHWVPVVMPSVADWLPPTLEHLILRPCWQVKRRCYDTPDLHEEYFRDICSAKAIGKLSNLNTIILDYQKEAKDLELEVHRTARDFDDFESMYYVDDPNDWRTSKGYSSENLRWLYSRRWSRAGIKPFHEAPYLEESANISNMEHLRHLWKMAKDVGLRFECTFRNSPPLKGDPVSRINFEDRFVRNG